jgi:hypothetical protein
MCVVMTISANKGMYHAMGDGSGRHDEPLVPLKTTTKSQTTTQYTNPPTTRIGSDGQTMALASTTANHVEDRGQSLKEREGENPRSFNNGQETNPDQLQLQVCRQCKNPFANDNCKSVTNS